tara:strand:+ start:6855 stop:7607 length:753 start_codon:yes stop_codon:yes gene_type:complete
VIKAPLSGVSHGGSDHLRGRRNAKKRRRKAQREKFVALYRHELNCEAYASLSPTARALLVEFRFRYSGGQNRIIFSIRQMAECLRVTEKTAKKARDELIGRGWIIELEKGAFHRKNRKATEYALTNQPLEDCDGAVAPKNFLSWRPPTQKNTVGEFPGDRGNSSCRGDASTVLAASDGGKHSHHYVANSVSTEGESPTHIHIPAGVSSDPVSLSKVMLLLVHCRGLVETQVTMILFCTMVSARYSAMEAS